MLGAVWLVPRLHDLLHLLVKRLASYWHFGSVEGILEVSGIDLVRCAQRRICELELGQGDEDELDACSTCACY